MSLDGRRLEGDRLVAELNATAGARGIGRIDHVENRLVGIKSREVYEAPAAVTLHAAHHALESLTITRDVARFQRIVGDEWARLVYDGLWFSALRTALDAFVQETQVHVTGVVRMRLQGGVAAGRRQARGAIAVQQRPRDLRPRRRHLRPRRGARVHRTVRPAAAHPDARAGRARGHGTTPRRAAHRNDVATPDRRPRGSARTAKVWVGPCSARRRPNGSRRYTSSLAVDRRLGADDVAGSRAHARMLRSIGVLDSRAASRHRRGTARHRRRALRRCLRCVAGR